VLHLSSSPSAASSRCVLPELAGHPYNAAAGFFRIRGVVPFPSCRSGRRGPCVERAKRSAVCGCPSVRPGTSPAASKLANSMYDRDFGGLGVTDILI
jgi:hypothetical protein